MTLTKNVLWQQSGFPGWSTQESLDGTAVHQYTYSVTNRMMLGKNLETGEENIYRIT
ncbi:MAG: hypothetical protein K2O16_00940 [Lachnospiraceae bacterium]|nr:hypothetical protein [Lachnospiraceae bacterium]